MKLVRFLIDAAVTAGLLVTVAQALPGVKCKSFGDAFKAAAIYVLLKWFLVGGALVMGFAGVASLALIPLIGPPLVAFIAVVGFFPAVFLALALMGGLALYLADQFVDGFELAGFSTAVMASVVVSLAHTLLAAVLPIV